MSAKTGAPPPRPIRIGAYVISYSATYQQIRDAWQRTDDMGVDVIYQPDHFTVPANESDAFPTEEIFECWSLMAAMAEVTERAEIGTLVTANPFRNPNLLADIARTVDHISGGRVILGLGAGHREREFIEYGYDFTPVGQRLRELERDLETIKARFGKLKPPPTRRVPILLGGSGEKTTLRIVAQHADIWHATSGDLGQLARKRDVLYRWCDEVGRDPTEIELATTSNKWPGHRMELDDPEKVVDLGFSQLIAFLYPPDYETTHLAKLVAWREQRAGTR